MQQLGADDRVILVQEVNHKVFGCDWGFWRLSMHRLAWDKTGSASSCLCTVAHAVTPKCLPQPLLSFLKEAFKYHEEKGLPLSKIVYQMHSDQALRERCTIRNIWPHVHIISDLKQDICTILDSSSSGSKESVSFVADQLQFVVLALQWSRGLFHQFIESMLARLVELDEDELIDFLQKQVLHRANGDLWSCHSWTHCSLTRKLVNMQNDEVFC